MKAPAVPPYATRVPGRAAGEYKTHNVLGQAKQALLNYPNLRRDPDGRRAFENDLELLRLDAHQGEYLPWVQIKAGTYPEDYPELAKGYADPKAELLTVRAAAALLGQQRSRVAQLFESGELERVAQGGTVRVRRTQVEELKAARDISAFYGGQSAPAPDRVAELSEDELAEAKAYGEAVNAPLSQATVDALNEKLASGDYPRRTVRPLAEPLSELHETSQAGVVFCGDLPELCHVDESPREPTEGEREFPVLTEQELDEVFGYATPRVFVIAYNRREFFQWCAQHGFDYQRLDWVFAPDGEWLRRQTQDLPDGQMCYILTPRATERGDWALIAQVLVARCAVRVHPDAGNERTRLASERVREVLAPAPKTLHQVRQALARAVVDLARIERRQEELPALPAVHPLTVLASRYRGTYEGAPWVAFNERPEDLKQAMSDHISGGSFFRLYERFKPIGRGKSPDEAIRDLAQKVRDAPHVRM